MIKKASLGTPLDPPLLWLDSTLNLDSHAHSFFCTLFYPVLDIVFQLIGLTIILVLLGWFQPGDPVGRPATGTKQESAPRIENHFFLVK